MKTKNTFLKHYRGNQIVIPSHCYLLLEVPRGELEVLVVEEVVDKADDDVWVWKIPESKIKNLNRLGLLQKTSENKLMDWGG